LTHSHTLHVISSSPRLWVFGEGETLRVYTGLCKNDALDLNAAMEEALQAVMEKYNMQQEEGSSFGLQLMRRTLCLGQRKGDKASRSPRKGALDAVRKTGQQV